MNTRPFILMSCLAVASIGIAHAQQPTDPRPATSETEGTAADRTPPNQRQMPPASPSQSQTQIDPRPSTNPAEGTAADRTAPGSTQTTGSAGTMQRSELVGATVVTPKGNAIGEVVDVVFDSVAKPTFVVIASEGMAAAVPYAVADSMKSGDKVVMDEAKLKKAPKVKQGEWRSNTSDTWKGDASRYWNKG